jgi:hypothetical protein
MAGSQSIFSPPAMAAMPEHEAVAQLQRLLPQATLQGAEPVPPPSREPPVVAPLEVEASTLRLLPKFARCCKTHRRRSSPRDTTS